MNLYLVRHGNAEQNVDDSLRILSQEGREEIRKIGSYLSDFNGVELNSILHSRFERTKQTAEILSEYLAPENGVMEVYGIEPFGDPSVAENHILASERHLMLVSHMPFLSRLTSHLLNHTQSITFRTGTVVCLKSKKLRWDFSWKIDPYEL